MVPSPLSRVLIVDDERALLLSYHLIFKRAGYEVTTADSTATALKLLDQQSFDLLLCDLTLGEENGGMRVLEAARQIAPGMPTVLMTGYSGDTLPPEIAQEGTNIVFKPIEIPRLLETVDFLLRGRRQRLWPRRA